MESTHSPTAPARDSVAFLLLMASVIALPLMLAFVGRVAQGTEAPGVELAEQVQQG